jgi:hypothetical protein
LVGGCVPTWPAPRPLLLLPPLLLLLLFLPLLPLPLILLLLLPPVAAAVVPAARGLHSSTCQLNLSRFCHKSTP